MSQKPNKIEEIRRAKKISMQAVADAINDDEDNDITTADASTISKIEKGKTRLSDRWIGPIAKALNVTPNDLFGTTIPAAGKTTPIHSPSYGSSEMPVMGTAAGSVVGADVLSSEPLEYVPYPPGLIGVREAYMLWVSGSSMSPKYESGEPIFINPHRPARQGDYVVVQVYDGNGGIKALVKRFVSANESTVVVEQFNPPEQITLKAEDIYRVHRVLTPAEIAGI